MKYGAIDIPNADAYQMLAYSAVFQAGQREQHLHLIYPHLPGLPDPLPVIRLPGDRHLHLTTVSLNGETPRVEWPGGSLTGCPPDVPADPGIVA